MSTIEGEIVGLNPKGLCRAPGRRVFCRL